MVATTQYYQHLYALNVTPSSQDETGEWVQGSQGWVYIGLCREETNGKGNTIQTSDGQTIIFSSLIQMPATTSRINEGIKILVVRTQVDPTVLTDAYISAGRVTGEVVIIGKNVKFDKGRLHCRMWI